MKIWSWKRNWTARHAEAKVSKLTFESVKRIAVLKHAALGDLILTRAFLVTLRQYFPNARITLSVAKHYMNGLPDDLVDHVHVVHSKESGKGFVARLKEQFSLGEQDLLFDISAVSRTFWLSLFSKASVKIGFKHKLVHRFIYDIAVDRTGYKFEAEVFMDQLLVLGLQYKWPLDFSLTPSKSSIEGDYIVYFPTASVDYKMWEFQRFAELIIELKNRYPDYKHVMLVGIADWEKKICKKIEALIKDKSNFQTIDGGEDTFSVIGGASLLISNDTGIRNLAIAYQRPTVCIFMGTCPFTYAPHFGQHEIVYKLEGGQPAVKQVLDASVKILDNLSK